MVLLVKIQVPIMTGLTSTLQNFQFKILVFMYFF